MVSQIPPSKRLCDLLEISCDLPKIDLNRVIMMWHHLKLQEYPYTLVVSPATWITRETDTWQSAIQCGVRKIRPNSPIKDRCLRQV